MTLAQERFLSIPRSRSPQCRSLLPCYSSPRFLRSWLRMHGGVVGRQENSDSGKGSFYAGPVVKVRGTCLAARFWLEPDDITRPDFFDGAAPFLHPADAGSECRAAKMEIAVAILESPGDHMLSASSHEGLTMKQESGLRIAPPIKL
jgi:hypothetical protein